MPRQTPGFALWLFALPGVVSGAATWAFVYGALSGWWNPWHENVGRVVLAVVAALLLVSFVCGAYVLSLRRPLWQRLLVATLDAGPPLLVGSWLLVNDLCGPS